MCLVSQGKVVKIKGRFADVDFNGNIKEVDISTIKNISKGEEIIVYSGKAIEKIKNG